MEVRVIGNWVGEWASEDIGRFGEKDVVGWTSGSGAMGLDSDD